MALVSKLEVLRMHRFLCHKDAARPVNVGINIYLHAPKALPAASTEAVHGKECGVLADGAAEHAVVWADAVPGDRRTARPTRGAPAPAVAGAGAGHA